MEVDEYEMEIKAAFRETYSPEWLAHMDKHSTSKNNIVEIMYDAFAKGYYASRLDYIDKLSDSYKES